MCMFTFSTNVFWYYQMGNYPYERTVRLSIVTKVPEDFNFQPKVKGEIRNLPLVLPALHYRLEGRIEALWYQIIQWSATIHWKNKEVGGCEEDGRRRFLLLLRNTNYLLHMKHNLQAVYRLVHHGGQRLEKKKQTSNACKLQCTGSTRYPIDRSSLGYMISWDIITGQGYPLDLVDCCASWVTRSSVYCSHLSCYSDWHWMLVVVECGLVVFGAATCRLLAQSYSG